MMKESSLGSEPWSGSLSPLLSLSVEEGLEEDSTILLLQSLYSFLKWMPLQALLSKHPAFKHSIRHVYEFLFF
jgi:hypothetical protein